MAYADRNTSGSRVVAIVLVALIIAGVGYAFVTGLAYQYIKKKVEDLNTFDVAEPPPPPEEVPPPPPPDTSVPPPPTNIVVPPALVAVPSQAPPIPTIPNIPPPPTIRPPAPPAPPAPPPPPRVAKKLTPRGNPQNWVTDADYPSAALRSGDQGVVGFRLDVDAGGRVTACTVTSSSGSSLLDTTACRLLQRRARFNAAEDANGNKIPASYPSRIRWTIPK
jgi:protein TonB